MPTIIFVPIKWLYWMMLFLWGFGGAYVIVTEGNWNGLVGIAMAGLLVAARRGLARLARRWQAP